jgi:hypothetical protein
MFKIKNDINVESGSTFEKRSSCPNKIHRNINNRGLYTDRKATIALKE